MPFAAFWDHIPWKVALDDRRQKPYKTTNESEPCTKSRQSSALMHPKTAGSWEDALKVKEAWDTTEKWQRTMLKRLVKQGKHYLPLPEEKERNFAWQYFYIIWTSPLVSKIIVKKKGIFSLSWGLEQKTKSEAPTGIEPMSPRTLSCTLTADLLGD